MYVDRDPPHFCLVVVLYDTPSYTSFMKELVMQGM